MPRTPLDWNRAAEGALAETLLSSVGTMKDIQFGGRSVSTIPTHRRTMIVVTVLLHVLLLLVLTRVRTPVRASSAGMVQAGIVAYVPGPVGAARTTASNPAPVKPKETTIARATKTAAREEPSNAAQAGSAAGTPGAPGGEPVRVGSGGSLTLVNKVIPVYPTLMQSARIPGQVVLDAIIHRDGTIGDITVLRSTNESFARAAIAAVKQWRYTPIPFEAIVTVTVNFTLPG